jgi:hypothetical protein
MSCWVAGEQLWAVARGPSHLLASVPVKLPELPGLQHLSMLALCTLALDDNNSTTHPSAVHVQFTFWLQHLVEQCWPSVRAEGPEEMTPVQHAAAVQGPGSTLFFFQGQNVPPMQCFC